MAIHKINTGTAPNNGTGDSLRTGAQKINATFDHFDEALMAIGSGEGGKSYATLADAQAVSPKPADGTVFQVEEATDPTNAGYHKFDSTETAGTKFLRGFLLFTKGVFDSSAKINETNPDIFEAIERLELYGANPEKKYFLKYFSRNRASNGNYYLTIEEEGHDDVYGVCRIPIQAYVENPNGPNVIDMIDSYGMGITGKVWIDWKKLKETQYPANLAFSVSAAAFSSKVHSVQTEKIKELKYDYFNTVIELGGFGTSDGVLASTNIRARSKDLIPVEAGDYKWEYSSPVLVKHAIGMYDLNGAYISEISETNGFFSVPNDALLRISYRKSDSTAISWPEIQNLDTSIVGLSSTGYKQLQKSVKLLNNKWRGGLLSALGDSNTYGFIPRNYTGYPGQLNSFAKLVADKLGMAFQNKGMSGTTLGALGIGDNTNAPFVYRYDELDNAAKLVLVMGGTNDIRKGVPLGTFNDSDETTYYGALHVLCLGLLQKYRHDQGTGIGQNKHIVLCTPLKLLGTDISAYAQAVREVGAYYSLPVWDAYNLSGINPHILRTVQGYEDGYLDMYNPYITDGTHPTQEGHEIMANALVGFLNSI